MGVITPALTDVQAPDATFFKDIESEVNDKGFRRFVDRRPVHLGAHRFLMAHDLRSSMLRCGDDSTVICHVTILNVLASSPRALAASRPTS